MVLEGAAVPSGAVPGAVLRMIPGSHAIRSSKADLWRYDEAVLQQSQDLLTFILSVSNLVVS
eukprot:1350356-Rhodomonas_salina.1